MRLLGNLLLLTTGVLALAGPQKGHGRRRFQIKRQEGQEPATYDDACNIGFCSVWGATIGGWGAEYTTVTTADEFASAVSGTEVGVIIVEGDITANNRVIEIGSSKSIIGAPGSSLSGISLSLSSSRNVILRNLKITSTASSGPQALITLQSARSIWVDHCDLSSSLSGSTTSHLLSIVNGTDYVSVSHNKFHSHRPSSNAAAVNVGHPTDEPADAARDKFHVTFARNHFSDVASSTAFRYGTGHVFNSFYENVSAGIDITKGGKLLLEGTVFEGQGGSNGAGGIARGVYSSDGEGYINLRDVVFVGGQYGFSDAKEGSLNEENVGYPYDWFYWEAAATTTVKDWVRRWAGQTLEFLVWE